MKMQPKLTCLLIVFGIANPGRSEPNDVTIKSLTSLARFDHPIDLPQGYTLRIDKTPSVSSPANIEVFQLILHYPDNREEVVWNAPGMQPNLGIDSPKGATKPVRSLHVLAAHISNDMLGAMLWKDGDDYWWLRWDLNKKELLPLIERPFRGDSDRYHFLDSNTVEVDSRTSNRLFTLKGDRDGNLTKNGVSWDKGYVVYGDKWEVNHAPAEIGGAVSRTENPETWPFITEQTTRPPATNAQEPPHDVAPSVPELGGANTPSKVIAKEPEPSATAQAPASTIQRGASVWPWLVGAFLALGLVGALALKRRV